MEWGFWESWEGFWGVTVDVGGSGGVCGDIKGLS